MATYDSVYQEKRQANERRATTRPEIGNFFTFVIRLFRGVERDLISLPVVVFRLTDVARKFR